MGVLTWEVPGGSGLMRKVLSMHATEEPNATKETKDTYMNMLYNIILYWSCLAMAMAIAITIPSA